MILLMQVDVGNFLRVKSCVLYTELENPDKPMINVEVVAHVTRPEFRSSEVSSLINRIELIFTALVNYPCIRQTLLNCTFAIFSQLFLFGEP